MTNTKTNRRALLLSVISLILCCAMLVGTTMAWFTDAVSSGNNVITAGNLDIELEYKNDVQKTYSPVKLDTNLFKEDTLWEPGHVEMVNLKISNLGTLTLKYMFQVSVLSETGGKNVAGDDFLLSEHLKFAVVDGVIEGGRDKAVEAASAKARSLKNLDWTEYAFMAPKGEASAVKEVTLVVWMPEDVDNVANYRGDAIPKITLGVNLYATQKDAEDDSFGFDYDAGALLPAVYTYDELVAAIEKGESVKLGDDITLPEGKNVEIPADKDITLNLNGKTLAGSTHKDVGPVIKNNGTLKLMGGTVSSTGANGGSAVVNKGTMTVNGTTLNGAPNADGGYPSYTVNNTGVLTVNNSTVTSKHGAVCSYGDGALVTLNNSTIDMAGIPGFTSHGIYTYNNGQVIVNGGTYQNKATDQNASGASVINGAVTVNSGNFSGRIENYYGTPVIKGGTFSENPTRFVAAGYEVETKDGKYVVSSDVNTSEDLDDLIQGGATEIVLDNGTYIIPDSAQSKTLTIKGSGDTVIATQDDGSYEGCDYSLDGSTVTFENITINTDSSTYTGYARMNGTYKNCTINGTYTLYGNSTFENCTFNVTGDVYNIWTWGAPTATFKNCTFNSDGKALLLYGQENTVLKVDGCTFNDKGGLSDKKAAIEIGNDYNKSYTLIVDDTTVNGYEINDKGISTGSTLWGNKNSMGTDKLSVTVDGVKLAWGKDNSIAAAVNSGATKLNLVPGTYKLSDLNLRGKTLTIKGGKDTVLNVQDIDGRNQFVTGATLKFEGVTLNFGSDDYFGFANTASLTYKDCAINGVQALYGKKVVFDNCTLGLAKGQYLRVYGAEDAEFINCTFNTAGKAILIYKDGGVMSNKVTVKGCTFNATEGDKAGAITNQNCAAIEIHNYQSNVNLISEGNTVDSDFSGIWRIKQYDTTNNCTITVNGTAYTQEALDGTLLNVVNKEVK